MNRNVLLALCTLCFVPPMWGASSYPIRPEDAKAIYLTPDKFPVHADGADDDSQAIQSAIDRAAEHGEGILFVPSGRYRITRTIYIWPAVRVIGYGETRPVFVLADNTPGYQQGLGYMFLFAGGKPRAQQRIDFATGRPAVAIEGTVPPDSSISDATPGTFYSGMSNVDIEIGKGNPAAVGIRCHYAQHSILTHMDFQIGEGLAGLKDVGNEAEDLHFHGGQYGIDTIMPSPGWQFTLIDSTFDGQSKAAIKEREAGLTLIHNTFRNVPTAISIDPEYSDELWVEHSRFENISGPAILFGNEKNSRTEVNLVDIACHGVKTFAQLRESGKTFSGPGENYVVKSFSYGLTLKNATDRSARLVSVTSDAFGDIMLHQSLHEGGVERMRMVDGIVVPAHGTVSLSPGGYHLMLMQPAYALKAGEQVVMVLHFADGGSLSAAFEVRPANAGDAGH